MEFPYESFRGTEKIPEFFYESFRGLNIFRKDKFREKKSNIVLSFSKDVRFVIQNRPFRIIQISACFAKQTLPTNSIPSHSTEQKRYQNFVMNHSKACIFPEKMNLEKNFSIVLLFRRNVRFRVISFHFVTGSRPSP
jgi:hypothetical protein